MPWTIPLAFLKYATWNFFNLQNSQMCTYMCTHTHNRQRYHKVVITAMLGRYSFTTACTHTKNLQVHPEH